MDQSRHAKANFGFLGIVLSQTLHSLEEYYFALWEVLAPARIVSNIVSDDVETGFIIINASVVLFAFWVYLWPVSKTWPSAHGYMWFWIILEIANCIGHTLFVIDAGEYFPGIYTTPLLFVSACYTGMMLLQSKKKLSDAE